jgi:dihydroorotase
MNNLIVRGGTIIDAGKATEADILVIDGKISAIGSNLKTDHLKLTTENLPVIDAKGLTVCPGLVDMHVHLREPGQEGKETVASGTRAAAKGGITSLACMPNTIPALDNPVILAYLMMKVAKDAVVRVYPVGCISAERKGESLADISALKESGVVGISDDGSCVMNALLARRAMMYAESLGLAYIEHAEDPNLADNGVMNSGLVALKLGLSGISPLAEEVVVARDILLAETTGVRLHITHISTIPTLALIKNAKKRGVKVTCDVTPHHLALTDEAVDGFNTNAKVNPPLRDEATRKALVAGVVDGTIDAIASDHAPHGINEKDVDFASAAFGIIGLETMLGLCLKVLGGAGMSLPAIIQKLTFVPAQILDIPAGTLKEGASADIAIFDPKGEWTVEAGAIASKSKNTPFLGWKLPGKVIHTIVGGKVVVKDGVLT